MNVPVPSIHPTRAIINLAALRHNLHRVKTYVGPMTKIMAVVKSHAYGHGVRTISHEVVRGGVHYLGVARVEEGLELRQDGVDTPILVFEIAPEGQCEWAISADLELSISSLEQARWLASLAQRMGQTLRVHAKVDTGMSRLGLSHEAAPEYIEQMARLRRLELAGVYSHFATAEDDDQSFALRQLHCFNRVLEELDRRRITVPLRHMANSAATITLPDSHFDMVRPGIMLYGYGPTKELASEAQLKPVMSLFSRITLMKKVPAGTAISYGRRFTTQQETWIATVPAGYGDGYSRMLTNKAEVLIRGKRYPVVGTICMDHCMIDVGTSGEVRLGDEVTLLGGTGDEWISAWSIAEQLGTIPYEVTCMVSARVPRTVLS
ncbi:MAG: alanine racemase [Bacteroidetes bacterium]|nr:alanine racemase [Bacteroidota bacterium]MCW5894097.1 alanine racemase [Bacteroidota bacterium]